MFDTFFAKRRLKRTLGEYLTPAAVDALADGRPLDGPTIQSGRIEFVFALIRGDTIDRVLERVAMTTDLAIAHGGAVHDIVGPLIVIAFGTLPAAQASPGSRTGLVTELHQRFMCDIKLLHGEADGHYGTFGSTTRMAYTFTFPRFDEAIAALGRVEFGHVEEFRA
jgi:hypothetical protein